MAVSGISSTNSSQGFFTSSGDLLSSDQLSSSENSADNNIAAAAAISIASEITEAAVTSISSQLNVAGTGYDSGVSDLVASAVAAGLKNQADDAGYESTPSLAIGGSFQNELLDQAAQDASTIDVAA